MNAASSLSLLVAFDPRRSRYDFTASIKFVPSKVGSLIYTDKVKRRECGEAREARI